MRQFKDSVAVITGAGAGLGKALAMAAARRGMRLVLADIEAGVLNQTVNGLRSEGADAVGIVIDVSDASAVDQLAQAAMDRFGQVHLLFNNAGVTAGGLVWENTEKDWDWLLGVNLKGVINGIRSFTPRMVASAAADPAYEGCIVNTASMAGLLTAPGMGIYSVSKHAVVALSECLRHDLQLVTPQLHAAVLCPSYVSTEIGHSDRNRPAHLLDAAPLTKSQLAARAAAQQAVKNGARVHLGGKPAPREGSFFEPTILTGITRDNPAYFEEFFGPVAQIYVVKDDDEAVKLANDSHYGLGGAVFSQDIERAKRMASRIETGMVYINWLTDTAPELPFGGVKRSGFGRELSELGIKEFVNQKLVVVHK